MLNSLHPYKCWEENGQYFFSTPSGAQYVYNQHFTQMNRAPLGPRPFV